MATARIDITLTGRTLLGHTAAKGQQLEDHYFGVIPSRVIGFMSDLEKECMVLGIPVKTRHNEVAPNQFELAPVFEEANLSVDHNLLLMDVMDKVADKHHLKVLFHEKPFAGINGSGKHNNWSLATDTGTNLLRPGSTPMKNLQFLTFFINTIKAVDTYESLLRASIASASNDHRLGANEAPPAIFSIFIGKQLSAVLDELEGVSLGKLSPEEKTELKLNVVGKIPEILMDNTDRNRTSPLAFTGNKFEMRGVGSKTNCAKPMTVLNTAVAQQLQLFKKEVDRLIDQKGLKKDEAIFNVLREYIKSSKRIRFEGDGYSAAWEKEAVKRKLSNLRTTPEAVAVMSEKANVNLFEQMGVLSPVELKARQEVEWEAYVMHTQIEGRVYEELVYSQILPSAVGYMNVLLENLNKMNAVMGHVTALKESAQGQVFSQINEHVQALKISVDTMTQARKVTNKLASTSGRAHAYAFEVKPLFEAIRTHADQLEKLMSDSYWPLIKYRELLQIR